jgi:hypothetical protein
VTGIRAVLAVAFSPDGRWLVCSYCDREVRFPTVAVLCGNRTARVSKRTNAIRRSQHLWDLTASIYKLLGIDPKDALPHPQGCVAYVSPLANGTVQSGGLLTEVM